MVFPDKGVADKQSYVPDRQSVDFVMDNIKNFFI